MIPMSLRGGRFSRRSNPPLNRTRASRRVICLVGDCFATGARNDMQTARLASHKGMISLRQLHSQTQEELDALLPSVLDKTYQREYSKLYETPLEIRV